MIQFDCARCGAKLQAPDDRAGGTIECPGCGESAAVPPAADAAGPDPLGALADAAGQTRAPVAVWKAPKPPDSNGPAVASLTMGLASVPLAVLMFFVPLAALMQIACAVTGGVLGGLALQNAKRTGKGRGLGLAGLILCLISMVFTIVTYITGRLLGSAGTVFD